MTHTRASAGVLGQSSRRWDRCCSRHCSLFPQVSFFERYVVWNNSSCFKLKKWEPFPHFAVHMHVCAFESECLQLVFLKVLSHTESRFNAFLHLYLYLSSFFFLLTPLLFPSSFFMSSLHILSALSQAPQLSGLMPAPIRLVCKFNQFLSRRLYSRCWGN